MREPILYCLTRDHDLARALDGALGGAVAFFYNDAARLNQAVMLRAPDLVVVDAAAVRPEYGDAGLGPVFDFLRHRMAGARLAVRPVMAGIERLVMSEAGPDVELLPADHAACVGAIARLCDRS